jgi:hypothetical protein
MAQPDKYPDLVRFGIRHNYINNFKSRIEPTGKARANTATSASGRAGSRRPS